MRLDASLSATRAAIRQATWFALLVGIAIGAVGTLAWPDLVYERRKVMFGRGPGMISFSDLTVAMARDGWRVVRVDNQILYQLERPGLWLPASEIAPASAKPVAP